MPFVQISLLEGRTIAQKHELMASVTKAVCDTLSSKPESVRVALYEVSGDDWSVAGKPLLPSTPGGGSSIFKST